MFSQTGVLPSECSYNSAGHLSSPRGPLPNPALLLPSRCHQSCSRAFSVRELHGHLREGREMPSVSIIAGESNSTNMLLGLPNFVEFS